jgi:hypothetical protein
MNNSLISETILKRLPPDPIGYQPVLHIRPSCLATKDEEAGQTQISEIPLAMLFGPVHGADLFDSETTAQSVLEAELEYSKGSFKIQSVCSVRPVSLDQALILLTRSSFLATKKKCQVLRKLLNHVDIKTEWHNCTPYYWGALQHQLPCNKSMRLRFVGHTTEFAVEEQQKVLDLACYIHLRRHPEKAMALLGKLSQRGQFESPSR